jgi:hypothetical protein
MVDLPFGGGKDGARSAILDLIGQLTGREPDRNGLARSVFYAIGFAALSDIQDDFITKSRGGAGADGTTWPPLSPEYLAYQRRFGPGEQAALKKAAGLGKANRFGVGGKGGLLTKQQQKRWNKLFAGNVAQLAARKPLAEAKSIAAAMAWNTIKAEGAKTKLEVYGFRKVDILRDTGILFNSLSPGYFDGNEYEKPQGEGGEQQVFRALNDGIVIGTNVPYAASHNYGDPKRGIPKRQFLPEVVPAVWQERWTGIGMQAVEIAIRRQLQEAA